MGSSSGACVPKEVATPSAGPYGSSSASGSPHSWLEKRGGLSQMP